MTDAAGNVGATGKELHLVGVNLHLEDGSGSTYDNTIDSQGNAIVGKPLLGLGNLIIGYNETQTFLASHDPKYTSTGPDVRTGSHNLIVGSGLNYGSFGGVVFGLGNGVGGPFATVTGGDGNIASGMLSSVSGGNVNTASGQESSVTGGYHNIASGLGASVTGGYINTASYELSSVGGGANNNASHLEEWEAGFQSVIPPDYFGNGSTALNGP